MKRLFSYIICSVIASSLLLASAAGRADGVSGTPIATQAEAQAATSNTKFMTPLRTSQLFTAFLATQGEAQAGTSNAKLMTPLRTANAIATYALYPAGVQIGSNWCESASTVSTGANAIPEDDTIPQSTEGGEVITCAYTAKISGSKLRINFRGMYNQTADGSICSLFIDSNTDATFSQGHSSALASSMHLASLTYEITAADTSAHTYKIRCGRLGNATAMFFNGDGTNRLMGGAAKTIMSIEEIKQ